MNINLKQQETTEFKIGEYTFYVRPFPAMKSANISGDLARVIGPAIGGVFSLVGSGVSDADDVSNVLSRINPEKAVSVLGNALGSLNGDEMERIIRRLLIDFGNVSVSGPCTDHKVRPLDMDAFNEVFCCETQNIFVLCWDVINLNFKGFFGNIGSLYGNQIVDTETQISNNMGSST